MVDEGGPAPLPEPVRRLTAHHLALVEERAPGLVEGLYLHGSLGWGEWYDGRSDVDFLAVTAERPDAATAALLEQVHADLVAAFPRPPYSGLYVTWADLAAPPVGTTGLPGVFEGDWSTDHGPDPVTWHELAHHGVRVHGPALAEVAIDADVARLRAYSHRNLTAYWGPRLAELEADPTRAARPDQVEWFVLGIPRLHHAISTGTLTSKDGAGHHALDVLGRERWRPVVAEALTHRALGEPSGRWVAHEDELAGEVLAFCRAALDAALALDPTDEPRRHDGSDPA